MTPGVATSFDRDAQVSGPEVYTGQAGLRDADLTAILRTYNEVTERLKQSHEALHQEVCRLRDEIERKNKELERSERLAALGQMAAGVAHEIRNPLGGVRLYASLLERDLHDRPRELDLVRRLETGVRNMESIVGDILAFAGDVEPKFQAVPLSGIIEQVLVQITPQADARGVILEVVQPSSDPRLWCDPRQIERALLNVLLNACEAMDAGGRVVVSTTCDDASTGSTADRHCHIHVEDNGPGLPAHSLHKLFNPFYTTKDTGTGLGLAIVHRIAEANGGRIRAANRPEGGAAFVLSIPLAGQTPVEPIV